MKFRKKVILVELESSYSTDPTPTPQANAILTRELAINTFQGNRVELAYDKPHLGNNKSLYTGPYTTTSFKVDLSGSGTPGVAPGYGPCLRACGLAETINATDITDTAQAGDASTITLDAAASAVNDEYNDLLITISSGTGAGQWRRIKDYVGSTKVATVSKDWTTPPDATSVFLIPAQVVYGPVSDDFESIYSYLYLDKVLHKLAGSRGTVQFGLAAEGIPEMTFNFTALRVPMIAGDAPASTFAFVEPVPVNKQNTPELVVHGYSSCTEMLSLDVGNTITYSNKPNCENVMLNDRKSTLQVAIEHPTVAQKNFDAIIAAHTADEVYVVHGTVAGNIVRIDAPNTQLSNPQVSDDEGEVLLTMDGAVNPSDVGNDEFFITVM